MDRSTMRSSRLLCVKRREGEVLRQGMRIPSLPVRHCVRSVRLFVWISANGEDVSIGTVSDGRTDKMVGS